MYKIKNINVDSWSEILSNVKQSMNCQYNGLQHSHKYIGQYGDSIKVFNSLDELNSSEFKKMPLKKISYISHIILQNPVENDKAGTIALCVVHMTKLNEAKLKALTNVNFISRFFLNLISFFTCSRGMSQNENRLIQVRMFDDLLQQLKKRN